MKIVVVSDVSIGYGSKQIPRLLSYLCTVYEAEGILLEPNQLERPPKHDDVGNNIQIKRLVGVLHPYSPGGKIEYVIHASEQIELLKPDLLIVCSSYTLPVLYKIKHRPKKILYYCLETPSDNSEDQQLNENLASLVDIIIFPEENRAINFINSTNLHIPCCVVYNCTNLGNKCDLLSPDQRNKKIIYHGGINEATAYSYYLNDRLQKYPIDVYGLFESPKIGEKERIRQQFLSLTGNVKYKGYLPSDKLAEIRKNYSYSLVLWLPLDLNTKFACPNKFFEAVASGVPPITAPHPQTKMLCNRYDCGIVMGGFDFDSFLDAISLAMDTSLQRYAELVNNCKNAVFQELNWETQMKKLIQILKI